MFNLTNGCIVYIFAFPSFNAIQLMILNWFIFRLEKKSKSTLQIVYTNVYTWRHAVDRAPSELDVFLSLTRTCTQTTITKQVL